MHRAIVLTRNDLARITKLRDGLDTFVAKLNGGGTAPAPVKRKPTRATAHRLLCIVCKQMVAKSAFAAHVKVHEAASTA